MKRLLPVSALALALSACVATPPLVMGEVAPPLTLPSDEIQLTVLDYTGAPLPGAQVEIDTLGAIDLVETDEAGNAIVKWNEAGISVTVDATAHDPQTVAVDQIPSTEDLEVRLSATVLDGIVTGVGGQPLPAAAVTLNGESVATDGEGRFQFVAAEAGELTVERPAYMPGSASWTGSGPVAVGLEPRTVRGLYINPTRMSGDSWDELLAIARDTEINTMVIDIKSETGKVYYDTGVALAAEVDAEEPAYDVAEIRRELDELDVYLIGRVVAFQDPIAAQARPDMSIIDTATGQPFNEKGQWFLDPTDVDARQYNIDLAIDACEAGIDEIQFDYVRYPYNVPSTGRFDGSSSEEGRPETITTFLATAREELHARGCAVSADIFGFITRDTGDGGIGQNLELLAEVTDAISPMVYPSHYSTGWYGFEVPNDHPGAVVAGAMDEGLARIEGLTILRPWFQDFWYDTSQVRAQIEEADARGVGWMLWHPGSTFTTSALRTSN